MKSARIAGKLSRVSHLAKAREVFEIEIAALKSVRAQLDKSFDNAVETVISALKQRGKIVIVGIGKSGNVGAKIAATLTSTGSTAVVLNSVDALHGDVGIVNDGDVILALSYSGESEELLNLLPALKRFSVKIISLTGNVKSSLARHSDLALSVKVPKEACPFNLAPTSSTTARLPDFACVITSSASFTERFSEAIALRSPLRMISPTFKSIARPIAPLG